MLGDIASLQPLFAGIIFLWAGAWKVVSSRSGEVAARSGLALLFRHSNTVQQIHRLLGTAELALGLMLLLPPAFWWETRLATGLATGFVGYLLFLIRAAPDRPCACLGGREARTSGRTLGRAILILLSTLLAWSTSQYWLTTAATAPWTLGLVVLELLILVGLSPELDWSWAARPFHPGDKSQAVIEPECATARVPLSKSLQQLRQSAAFQAAAEFLKSGLSDHWRDGCWRFLCFEAEHEGRKATAVFAIQTMDRPQKIRAAIVDEVHGAILWTWTPGQALPQ